MHLCPGVSGAPVECKFPRGEVCWTQIPEMERNGLAGAVVFTPEHGHWPGSYCLSVFTSNTLGGLIEVFLL